MRNSLVRRAQQKLPTFGVPRSAREVCLDAIHVTIEAMHVDSVGALGGGSGGAAEGARMLRDVSLDVVVERGLGHSADLPLSVSATSRELAADCSSAAVS